MTLNVLNADMLRYAVIGQMLKHSSPRDDDDDDDDDESCG